jgi:WhiB family redox-sensing transcriptional regulator
MSVVELMDSDARLEHAPAEDREVYAGPEGLAGGSFGDGSWAAEDEGALGWQERALCAQTDPEAFFPEKGGSTREAKRVCLGCDVRSECLDYALAHDERFGIWGGLSERERRRLKKLAV